MPVSRKRKNRGKGEGAKERRRRVRQHNEAVRDRLRAEGFSDYELLDPMARLMSGAHARARKLGGFK
jgi:hypothetical protein